ncbi:hypothetical protein [Aquabacterium sp.]|uniref:hypothetical protein n=1 Tax=Aquabacterium sp. TaxID=1872578 RepID=UPI002B83FBE6|nr:hypothetical protein [Aquabacterium sp.]HSW04627.1 hypothetical protein [Aquabacterium sp.]
MTRQLLRTICRTLIGVLLFAQLAVSAYACPGVSSAPGLQKAMATAADGNSANTDAAMNGPQAIACADMAMPMDPDFANLCAEHCRQGQQSDQAATLTVPAALLTALYITAPAPEPLVAPRPAAATPSALAAASPPLAILHCCFRT